MKLFDLITDSLPANRTVSGDWYNICCPLCSDRKFRGGFRQDGDTVIYNCFKCGEKYVYKDKLSKNFRRLLNLVGVDNQAINTALGSSILQRISTKSEITIEVLKNAVKPVVQLPAGCQPCDKAAAAYLRARNLDNQVGKFLISPKLKDRVILPFYDNGKLVYWQARTTVNDPVRYKNPPVNKDDIIYNVDELYTSSKWPLFITEGIFDALHVNGCAILGSSLSEEQLKRLRHAYRTPCLIVDPDKNGIKLAKRFLEEGWDITFANELSGMPMDTDAAIKQYGKLFVFHQLGRNRTSDQANLLKFQVRIR